LSETLGLALWCQDEAGPYQALPQPGASWQPSGEPKRQPHEYVRGGTAKLLTLFHPASGKVRAQPVASAPNSVLHPWLKAELTAILATLPALSPEAAAVQAQRSLWEAWQEGLSAPFTLLTDLPPLRLLLVLDNLAGHKSAELVCWLMAHGIMPLYTPVAGSWLNMAESIQRIIVRRALSGQQPETTTQVMDWLSATVRGWNASPTPFAWGGKRAARRTRARSRRHTLGGSGACTQRPIRRSRAATRVTKNG
jgi:DDE superfamily endonuclease